MLLTMFFLMTMLMMTFIFLKHPLSMGLILMLQTILTCVMTGMMIEKFWYSYILFMVMIGGMLVLLLYMTSIMSNEKFKFSWKLTTSLTMLSIPALIVMWKNDLLLNSIMLKTINIEMTMMKFFQPQTSLIMIMLIFYLLITLIAVVNITNTNFGPLRQK